MKLVKLWARVSTLVDTVWRVLPRLPTWSDKAWNCSYGHTDGRGLAPGSAVESSHEASCPILERSRSKLDGQPGVPLQLQFRRRDHRPAAALLLLLLQGVAGPFQLPPLLQ